MLRRFSASKCGVQCKLCLSRVKLMRNKRTIALKQLRREVADLLRANKQESARIRVEAVLRETNLLQAYEILELYLELLAVRAQLVEKSHDKEPPLDMQEALSSLIYASSRVQDLPELGVIRGMLALRYDKAYIQDVSSETTCNKWSVNENLHQCLVIGTPKPEDKLALLSDIAQEYGVEWDLHGAARDLLPMGAASQQGDASSVSGGEDLPFPIPGTPASSVGGQPKWGPPGGGPPGGGSPGGPPGGGGGFGAGLAANPVVSASRRAAAADPAAQYAEAQESAAAAAAAAKQAQHYAEEAQRHADSMQVPMDNSHKYPESSSAFDTFVPPPAPAGYGPPPSEPDSSPFAGFDKPPGPSVPGTGRRFLTKSDSQIKREYDAAPGPPSKGDKGGGGASFPSIPPANPTAPTLPPGQFTSTLQPAPTPPFYDPPSQPPPVGGGSPLRTQSSGLPPVPGTGGPQGAAPPAEKPLSPEEEVKRRFAALKNN